MVRIRSEHAIGFLKGRFHSLKNLRLAIKDADGHKLATYWIAACITVHAFAMQCEHNEQSADESDAVMRDPFIAEGLSSDDSESGGDNRAPSYTDMTRLQGGKVHRQRLKERLFRTQARRAEHHN